VTSLSASLIKVYRNIKTYSKCLPP